jgi:hypothetical protein
VAVVVVAVGALLIVVAVVAGVVDVTLLPVVQPCKVPVERVLVMLLCRCFDQVRDG